MTGFAAGNLLFLAASDLLPRIHGQLKEYGGMNKAAVLIVVGFAIMSGVITWTHETFGHGHEHEEGTHTEEVSDHAHEEGTPEDHTH